MKKFLLGLVLFLSPMVAQAQSGVNATYIRMTPTALPTACRQGDVRVDSTLFLLQVCSATNTWTSATGTSPTSIGNLDAQAANTKGLALVSNVLSAQSADATHPGVVNTTTQTFAGVKTFSSTISGSVNGNAATATLAAAATALAANPTDCGSNVYATAIDASGNLTCASITNASTTAVSTNTNSTIVLRDGSGNFSAGTVSAAVTGTASGNTTYTANQYGVVLSGSGNTMSVIAPVATTTYVLSNTGGTGGPPTWAAPASAPSSSYEQSNLGIANSASTGVLTVALKQSDGSTDPSSGAAAVKVGMRSSTLTSGLYNQRSITAALSQTLTAGTTLGMVITLTKPLWYYLIDSDGAGTMKIGISSIRYPENVLQSTLAESFSATATNATPCVFTATAHGLQNNDAVALTGTPPTGFSIYTTTARYFVVNKATNTFQLSATPGGTAINSTSTGSSIVIHIANTRMVSDAVYTNVPVRLIGRATFALSTVGTWVVPLEKDIGGAGMFPPEKVGISYTGAPVTGTLSGSPNPVTFGTLVDDSHNTYVGNTWVVPIAGTYSGQAATLQAGTYAAGNNSNIYIYLNGAARNVGVQVGFLTAGNLFPQVNVHDIILSQGDLVTVQSLNNSSSPSFSGGIATQDFMSFVKTND